MNAQPELFMLERASGDHFALRNGTEKELSEARIDAINQLGRLQAQVGEILAEAQKTGALISIIDFELERRRKTIVITSSMPN